MSRRNVNYIDTYGNNIGAPVAIGGVGGSGTRLVAEIVIRAGVNLSGNLNKSNDNLDFTKHFKRNDWFENFPEEQELEKAWTFFLKDRKIERQDPQDEHNSAQGTKWGWKEPNTHIFLPFLSKIEPDLKYIHVLRNGLDMAFSRNQQQATNWGQYVLGRSLSETVSPVNSLDYWLQANAIAIENGRKLGDRFLLLKYEELCFDPTTYIEKLVKFLGRQTDMKALSELIAPTTINRHKEQDLSVFSADRIKRVENMMATQF